LNYGDKKQSDYLSENGRKMAGMAFVVHKTPINTEIGGG
jgi:hypothetical protein